MSAHLTHNPNLSDPSDKYVVIYYDKEETCFQIIRPIRHFKGDWRGLVCSASKSDDDTKNYDHYDIKNAS